ncbi:DDHD domain-containing protein [Xylogone sp. PMI_703]|nr:DDHD domain-containing protein [Xylogone sp. PMI_703]
MSSTGNAYSSTHRSARPIRAPDLRSDDDIPELKAHYFYVSPLSIDDPLSVVPTPAAFEGKAARNPPRPFSPYDSSAIEKAWLSLTGKGCRQHNKRKSRKSSSSQPVDTQNVAARSEDPGMVLSSTVSTSEQIQSRQGWNASSKELGEPGTPRSERIEQGEEVGNDSGHIFYGSIGSVEREIIQTLNKDPTYPRNIDPHSQVNETGTTGLPFVRAPSRMDTRPPPSLSSYTTEENEEQSEAGDQKDVNNDQPSSVEENVIADVPVGVSRLHHVELPALIMKPIYWSPVHDIAAVTRGTWFYKDTLFPLDPAVANQLEIGYRELRPWSQTWRDELNSAIEVGAAGEEKVAHRLWPKENDPVATVTLPTDPACAASCFHGEAAAEGKVEAEGLDGNIHSSVSNRKRYADCQVIYRDFKNAFILKPSLQPSAYYGRKPLQKIKKGVTVGIHVVRGLDWRAWEKLHPPKAIPAAAKLNTGISNPPEGSTEQVQEGPTRPKVTDLVLVIHGIGQKLSERVESFHFTHAINSFRRSINLELNNNGVRRVLRDDLGGVMILPVNWRSNLSFEDGGPMKKGDKERASSLFSLKDITIDSIPAVRNIISDVMLDIPFYMSHHKPKMIQAVISEANRVYRLWCKNNPGFHQEGRVHIIAHSLGSAMALEVLSKQPTFVPRVDLEGADINRDYFDFPTTNVFFAGSPAGFFLLLDRGKLLPRKGRKKPGAEPGDDTDRNIVGDEGTFGCLAVDNIYNIMHLNDPIAYRLNATVDPVYAATLKDAFVPSVKAGFFESIGNAMKSLAPGAASATEAVVGQVPVPALVTRLPSQLELEVHDFTREEIAERKFYLLNDNGQVDWFLSPGGGPLDIQYINMLGAHSSYWDKWIEKERVRWARLFKVPLHDGPPTGFPPLTVPIMRALCVISAHGGQGPLTKALDSLYQAYWADNRPTQNKEVLEEVLSETLGQKEAQKVMTAVPKEGKELLIKNTDMAFADGAFGLPWFVVTNENGEKETFWGVDHLGQVIDFLGLEHPKTGGWRAQL